MPRARRKHPLRADHHLIPPALALPRGLPLSCALSQTFTLGLTLTLTPTSTLALTLTLTLTRALTFTLTFSLSPHTYPHPYPYPCREASPEPSPEPLPAARRPQTLEALTASLVSPLHTGYIAVTCQLHGESSKLELGAHGVTVMSMWCHGDAIGVVSQEWHGDATVVQQ